MKSLVNTIKEGLYGNLGVDNDLYVNLSQDWVKKYNLQRGNNMELIIGKNGKICSIYKQPVYQLGINDDSILVDGCLPSYLSFEAGDNITVEVGTTELKSFINLPEVERMVVRVSAPINYFNTITNCKYLGLYIFTDSSPVITNVQPTIHMLIFNPISRNEEKLNKVYLFIDCNSSEKIDIENYFIKKYSSIKFIVLR